jgi:hypothetical protein
MENIIGNAMQKGLLGDGTFHRYMCACVCKY